MKVLRWDTVEEGGWARNDQVLNLVIRRLETSDGGFGECDIVSLCGDLTTPPGIDGGLFAFLACHRDSHTIQNIFLDSRCSKHIRKFHHVCTQFDFDQYVDRRRRRKEVEEIPDNVPRMIKVYRRGFNALLGSDIKQALYEFTG